MRRLITERSKEVIQASTPGTPRLTHQISMPDLLIDLPGEQEPLLSEDDECDLWLDPSRGDILQKRFHSYSASQSAADVV